MQARLWDLARHGEALALIDAASGRAYSYRELEARALALAERLKPRTTRTRALVCIAAALDVGSIVAYLGALAAGHALWIIDRDAPEALCEPLYARYHPDFILRSAADGVDVEVRERAGPAPSLHRELALLLSTSGTTGSAKLVRLSYANLRANAEAIVSYLGLGPDERAMTSLPLHYSYGLSVLNSHLQAGGSLVVCSASVLRPEFWQAVRAHGATAFAGVPYTYRMLDRLSLDQLAPNLRTLTQAGGRMPAAQVERYQRLMAGRGGRFFAMYGQTEATARISYLPPERALEKPASVGVAVPGGSLHVMDGERELDEPLAIGEIVYRGPNVMLGYASSSADLALGDTQGGELRTGDLGYLDSDGFLYLRGRLKRFAKLYGLRVNLDDVEEQLRSYYAAAVVSDDERVYAFVESDASAHEPYDLEALRAELAARFGLHANTFRCERLPELPRLASGKIDYDALQRRIR